MAESSLAEIDEEFFRTHSSKNGTGTNSRPSSVVSSAGGSFASATSRPQTPRKNYGIKPKIYDSPESLTMEQAYDKIYSCSSRSRHRQRARRPKTPTVTTSDLLQSRLVDDGGAAKAVSEDGKEVDLDAIAEQERRTGAELPHHDTLPAGLGKNDIDPDNVGHHESAPPSSPPSNSKPDDREINTPQKIGEPLDHVSKILQNDGNQVDLCPAEPLLPQPPRTSQKTAKPVYRDNKQMKFGKGPDRGITTTRKVAFKQGLAGPSSSGPSKGQDNKSTILLPRNKARAQSPSPFRGVLKNSSSTSRTDLSRTGSPASASGKITPTRKPVFSCGMKTPVNSKIPLALTPKYTPKTIKKTQISSPLKAKPLQLPEADADANGEISPMSSLTSTNTKDSSDTQPTPKSSKEMKPTKPTTTTKRQGVSGTPASGSYLERQKAKLELAKKPDILNEKIRRRIRGTAVPQTGQGQKQHQPSTSPISDSLKDAVDADNTTFVDSNIEEVPPMMDQQSSISPMSETDPFNDTYDAEDKKTVAEIVTKTVHAEQQSSASLMSDLIEEGGDKPSKEEIVTGISDQKTPVLYDSEEEELKLEGTKKITPSTSKSAVIVCTDANINNNKVNNNTAPDTASPEKVETKPVPVVMIPCRFKVAGCTESIVRGTPGENEHYRKCQFRPIPCILHHTCKEMVPFHNFFLHLQAHYLTPNFTKSLTTTVFLTEDTFKVTSDTWTPKWLRIKEYDANFFLMLTRSKGAIPGVNEACWICWVWMMGSQDEASNFFYEIDIFKDDRKISGTFTAQSIRNSPADIIATKSCLSFTDQVAKHIASIGDTVLSDFFIDVYVSKKPSTATPVSCTGEYKYPA